MTTREVKQWLWRARGIDKEIASLQKYREKEYERLTSITAQLSGMTVSSTKDPHKYDSLSELNDAIDRSIKELEKIKSEILDAINRLEDQRYRSILRSYYVYGMNLEKIAVEMNYSFPHIKRLRREAIESLKMILE